MKNYALYRLFITLWPSPSCSRSAFTAPIKRPVVSSLTRVPGQPLFLQNLNCHCFDPQTTIVLNPYAWVNPPVGQSGTSAAYYSDYRKQRHPIESMNIGRTWRVKERASTNVRMEFTNVFNRSVFNDPSSTNAQGRSDPCSQRQHCWGFGSIIATGTIAGSGLNLEPRSGTLIGPLTF